MAPNVIFEDDAILVIDKPSGWIVNEAATTTTQPVLQTWLKENVKYPIVDSSDARSGIVHRLDKETSGVLLVAKTKEAFEKLQRQFKERLVKKTYTALVHGRMEEKEGEIMAPVGRLPWRRDRFGVLPGGREAKTRYKVLQAYGDYTLVELYPETGRTHQIRIHLKHINHPIVGDSFYAGRKTARKDRTWCPRLFLHASAISFFHPTTGTSLMFKSTLPQDLRQALAETE